jgi:hypothetical protein
MNPNSPGGPPGGYPPGGYPPGGYPQAPAPGYPQQATPGYPQQGAPGYPPQQPAPGYPQQAAPGYPQAPAPGYPPQGAPGYPQAPAGYPQPGMPQPGAPPYGAPPGMPGANAYGMGPNLATRLGSAQGSLQRAGGMLRTMQILFTVLGGLMAVGGVLVLILVDAGGGIGLLITGVVMVGVAWFTLPKFMGQLGGATAMVNAMAAKEQLAMTGIPTTARVMQMQQTGTMVNNNPQVMATLQVNGPQGPYAVQTTAIVPIMNIAQFQPGAMVNVRVNPQNPMDVAVVF